MLKKTLIALATLCVAGLLVASSSAYPDEGVTAQPGAPAIALVNEDEPASVNGSEYTFGKEFVSLVSNDNRYNWQVVSRSVAERAYTDEAVSAVIVLPQSFTHDILTFQDLAPAKAVIDYRVLPDDELSTQRLQNEVFTILRDFNTRVVQMYFASVADNISGAQLGMESVVTRYGKLVGTLADDVQPKVAETGEDNKRSGSLAQILRAMNSAWIVAQNGFTTTTTNTLTSISGSLAGQQPKLAEYFSLQEEIAATNVLNGNAAISDQAASDSDYFGKAFSDHVGVLHSGDGAWSGFDGLSSVDAGGNATGALAQFQEKVKEYDQLATSYNAKVGEISASLTTQRDSLAASAGDLGHLTTTLLDEYFSVSLPADSAAVGLPAGSTGVDGTNYDKLDVSKLPSESARRALAEKVARTLATGPATSNALAAHEQTIRNLVAGIATDPIQYAQLSTALESTTSFDPAPYERQLRLIRQYADANGIVGTALHAVPSTRAAAAQTVTKTLPVTVPAGESDRVEVHLPDALSPSDVTATVGPQPGADRTTVDQATDIATIDNTRGTEPVTVTVTYAIDLHDAAGDLTLEYTATNTTAPPTAAQERSLGTDRYVLVPATATAGRMGDDFPAITSYLGDVETAANLLRFLYAAPGESEDAFTTALQGTGDFAGHSTDSVYNRYGAIDASAVEDLLSDEDVADYQKLGRDNIEAVVTQVGALTTQRTALNQDIASLKALNLSPSYFSNALQQLESWYASALTSINAAPGLWAQKSNTVIQLATTAWDGQEAGRAELYLDEQTGPALHQALSRLVETSSRDSQTIAASARLIDDNSGQFDELMAGVQRTQKETDSLLAAMKGTIATESAGAAESGAFSSRFATVLSNTRARGVDPATIYDAFANPVTAKDSTPAAKSQGEGFDYRWIGMFAAGSLVGALIAGFLARGKGRPVARK